MTDYTDPQFWDKYAKPGATHYNPINGDCYRIEGDNTQAWSTIEGRWIDAYFWNDRKHLCVARPLRPSPFVTGNGLPQAGNACECKCTARRNEREWFAATVNYISPYTVVLDDGQSGEFVAHPAAMQFRKIRTPAQLAAEKRQDAIYRAAVLCKVSTTDKEFQLLGELYDAGLLNEVNT